MYRMPQIMDTRLGPVIPKVVRIPVTVFQATAHIAADELTSHTEMINRLLVEALEARGVDVTGVEDATD